MSEVVQSDRNIKGLSVGIVGAVFLHILTLIVLEMPTARAVIPAETYSPPTMVSVHFKNPVNVEKIVEPIIEPLKQTAKITPVPSKPKLVTQKPVIKKIAKAKPKKALPKPLNKIEPAAAMVQKPQPQRLKPAPQKAIAPAAEKQNAISITRDIQTKGRRAQPQYPKASLRQRHEGVVLLRVLVSDDGKREDIKIHQPSRYAALNNAAMKAVKKWKFKPNIINGRAVRSWVEIPIEFKIQ